MLDFVNNMTKIVHKNDYIKITIAVQNRKYDTVVGGSLLNKTSRVLSPIGVCFDKYRNLKRRMRKQILCLGEKKKKKKKKTRRSAVQ